MIRWLAALVASSFTFALADVLCDICITESEEEDRARTIETADDDDESETGIELCSVSKGSGIAANFQDAQQTPLPARYKTLSGGKQLFDSDEIEPQHEEKGLSGAQDAAIAGLMNTIGVVISGTYWLATNYRSTAASAEAAASAGSSITLRWRPSTHYQWWFAMLGGGMNFLHYFFFLKAFEGAPSTVLLPLVQVASVSVFLGSSVVALLRHEPWITPAHALAYLLMFVGGILPACAGNLSVLLKRSFWRQSFVAFAIAAEFSLGLHDLMLSGCAYKSHAAPPASGAPGGDALAASATSGAVAGGGGGSGSRSDDSSESFEFFVWSRFSFIATFVGIYCATPSLTRELRELLSGSIENKYVALSAISEGLTIVGFYLASIAYGLFYQAGIVHAAEASLSQLLNLALAYILLRGCGLGRSSAVSAMRIKLVSFIMVTIGLFLCTLDAGGPSARTNAAPSQPLGAPQTLPVPAAPYVSQTDLLLGVPPSAGAEDVAPMAATVVATTAVRMLRSRRRL